MTMSVSLVFSQLLARLEAVGGEISVANLAGPGGFYIVVNHPDVNIDHRDNGDTVQIKCRKGMFPPTRAHTDVDDIMIVIEGWMKEAGGKCGASKTPNYGELLTKDDEHARDHERRNERAAILANKRREWGVDRPLRRAGTARTGMNWSAPYKIVAMAHGRALPEYVEAANSQHEAEGRVRLMKQDPEIGHIEIQPLSGNDIYYDRQPSGRWTKTVM